MTRLLDIEMEDVVLPALCVWREARGVPGAWLSVFCTIRDRVENPKWWGRTLLEVIGKRWQYSAMTAKGDPMLLKWPMECDTVDFRAFQEIKDVVLTALICKPVHPFPGADSYFDDRITRPAWATDKTFCGRIGPLEFHNTDFSAEKVVPVTNESTVPVIAPDKVYKVKK